MMVPLILVFVAGQRLWELWLANRNTRRLRANGGVEAGARHYPLFVALHASWLAAIAILTPWDAAPQPPWLGLYILLQAGRAWVIASLGGYWTTRIITVPGAPLVRTGPYRWLRHPNYLVASLEIAVLPLVFGQLWIALVWSLLNAALVCWRIRVEDQALRGRRGAAEQGPPLTTGSLTPRGARGARKKTAGDPGARLPRDGPVSAPAGGISRPVRKS